MGSYGLGVRVSFNHLILVFTLRSLHPLFFPIVRLYFRYIFPDRPVPKELTPQEQAKAEKKATKVRYTTGRR